MNTNLSHVITSYSSIPQPSVIFTLSVSFTSFSHRSSHISSLNINEITRKENEGRTANSGSRVCGFRRSKKGSQSFDGSRFSGAVSVILFTRHASRYSTDGIRSRLETCLPTAQDAKCLPDTVSSIYSRYRLLKFMIDEWG